MKISQFTGNANPLWNPWCSQKSAVDLYRQRCRGEVEEMTCARQAAAILGEKIEGRETLLDAGCGGGYYYWSFKKRGVPIDYFGLDYTPEMIELARSEMCRQSDLLPEQFRLGAIEYLNEEYDNILCFHVLTNSPHYALPLERLLYCTRKRLLLRESLADELTVRFTADPYLDEGKRHIRVYHNTYPINEVVQFIEQNGFRVTRITDERSQDGMEMVVDIPHYWRILLAERK